MLLVLLAIGVASGILFDVFFSFVKLFANDKITKHFFNFLASFFSFFALFFANLHFNYGQFRLYLIFVFACGFAIEKTISKFLWTKLIKRCYIKKKGERSGQKKAQHNFDDLRTCRAGCGCYCHIYYFKSKDNNNKRNVMSIL